MTRPYACTPSTSLQSACRTSLLISVVLLSAIGPQVVVMGLALSDSVFLTHDSNPEDRNLIYQPGGEITPMDVPYATNSRGLITPERREQPSQPEGSEKKDTGDTNNDNQSADSEKG